MRYLFIILLVATFVPVYGQPAYMKDGKVIAGDTVYCHYKEYGQTKEEMTADFPTNVLNPTAYPQACNDAFRDYSFSGEYRDLIKLTAKAFATVYEPYIIYYYNIRFTPTGQELNIRYHPMLVRSFVKDLAKHNVISGGFVNEKNLAVLIKKWGRKSSLIEKTYLQEGIVTDYNETEPFNKRQQTIPITIQDEKIFRNDTLIGYYCLLNCMPAGSLWGSTSGTRLYLIKDTSLKVTGILQTSLYRSSYFLRPAGENESLALLTTDREEKKIIASAVKVLMVHNQNKQAISALRAPGRAGE